MLPCVKVLALAVLVLAGCLSPVMTFGGGKSAPQAQHETLTTFVPGRLSLEKTWTGPVTDARIRVYADDEYRAQNRRWREAFDERLDYVNAVLAAKFGVRLVPDYREWKHHAPGASLDEHLAALVELDDGRGVLTVVGLTSSLSLASATFEQLGVATLAGRHMIVRGFADLAERKAFERAFPDLSADERENALVTMRIHKNASLFLHELGHNLGAEHDAAPDTLMSAAYSRSATAFGTDARTAILRTLDERLGRARTAPEPSQTASPTEPPRVHQTLRVIVVAGGAIIDGVNREDDELNILFGVQAGIDRDVNVVVSRGKGVSAAAVSNVVERIKAAGLTRIRFE
jgi:hypothetical protein